MIVKEKIMELIEESYSIGCHNGAKIFHDAALRYMGLKMATTISARELTALLEKMSETLKVQNKKKRVV